MNNAHTSFPLFNRIVVFVTSGGLLVGLAVAFASPKFRNDLDLVNGFILMVFAVMAGFGCWISLFWKERTPEELKEEDAFPSVDRPNVPEDALASHFSMLTRSAAVFIDQNAGVLYFKNCHVPRKFVASAQPWFSCPVGDLKGVHVFRYRGESLTIVTASGKVLVPHTATDYSQLRQTLKELVPHSQSGFSSDHPMMGMVYLAGILIGLFAGVFLTPDNASNSTMGLFVLGGSILGSIGSHLFVSLGDRCLKIGMAQPIGFGMLGACIGLAASSLLRPAIGWNLEPTVVLILIGAIVGVLFGVIKQTRERQS
jgi:hypothetical protein